MLLKVFCLYRLYSIAYPPNYSKEITYYVKETEHTLKKTSTSNLSVLSKPSTTVKTEAERRAAVVVLSHKKWGQTIFF
jgi:hypothetical protein